MNHLQGLDEYLAAHYEHSVFDQAVASGEPWEFVFHGQPPLTARILENLTYDLKVEIEGRGPEELAKLQIELLYPAGTSAAVRPQLKTDAKVRALGLEPIRHPGKRYFVKNKSLFPLMQERQVVFFILLAGEVLRGVIAGFSRYEIELHLKGGVPVTLMRHSVYDLRNKQGRCFLKSFQQQHRDWEKSPLYAP
jgi:hypothetical protein